VQETNSASYLNNDCKRFFLLFFQTLYFIFMLQSDQQENKSRVLPHLLFYRNVCLSLIVHLHIAIHSRFIGSLPLEKSIIY
jgi:hypothetical protein